MEQQQQHEQTLRRALELAMSRRGYCAPNPAVGALIVKDGMIISEGAHQACGQPHAEAVALKRVGAAASGATLYVSLEPCCHQGRTPPCTDAIVAAGIRTVVYGYQDPNPIVAGQGHQQLLATGVEVLQIRLPEMDEFYRSYRHWQQYQKPWVRAKIALSLDGKIAGPAGERIHITGLAVKQHTYQCRQRSDAILTTAKTILHDDPSLDVRLENIIENKRLYILDRDLQLSTKAQIWQNTQPITVFYSAKKSGKLAAERMKPGVHYIEVPQHHERLDLDQILAHIGQDGVHDLWVEAGGILLESLLAVDFVNELQIICAPKWLGSSAQSAFSSNSLNFERFSQKRWVQMGDDAVCEMRK